MNRYSSLQDLKRDLCSPIKLNKMKKILTIAIMAISISVNAQYVSKSLEQPFRNYAKSGRAPSSLEVTKKVLIAAAKRDVPVILEYLNVAQDSIDVFCKFLLDYAVANPLHITYTNGEELIPYIERAVLVDWPSDQKIMLAHYVFKNNQYKFAWSEREKKPNEKLLSIDGVMTLSNFCYNPATVFGKINKTVEIKRDTVLQLVGGGLLATSNFSGQKFSPLNDQKQVSNGITPEEELLVKRANFYGNFRRDLGEANDQSSFTIKKQRKPLLKTTFAKVIGGGIIATGLYLLVRALLPKAGGAGVGGSPTSPGNNTGGSGGSAASNGG